WSDRRPLGFVVAELILTSHRFEKLGVLFHSLNHRIDSRRINWLRRWAARAHPGLRKEIQLSSRDLPIPAGLACPLPGNVSGSGKRTKQGRRMSTKSPTLAELELQGFVGFYVTCANPMCRYSTPIRFESLRLDPSTPFSAVRKMRCLECAACGSLEVSIIPEQREYKAS